MSADIELASDGSSLTVRVPLAFRRVAPRARIDSTLVKALARAYRWKRLLESGEYASVAELAAVEKINQSYLCRVLRLTLLAPEIVEAILDGTQPVEVTLDRLMRPFPVAWEEQGQARTMAD